MKIRHFVPPRKPRLPTYANGCHVQLDARHTAVVIPFPRRTPPVVRRPARKCAS